MKKLTIRYDDEFAQQLRESSQRNGRSINQQVLFFLRESLLFDEEFHSLPKEKKLLVLQATREIIKKLND